jgi:crossover junction endonuclease MUS81
LLIDEIKSSNIKHQKVKLNIGDFTWIARDKGSIHDDVILNFIVERKRMDDLCQSIKDKRYKEQKVTNLLFFS